MKFYSFILLSLTTVITTFGVLEHDWGLEQACQLTGGKYVANDGRQDIRGDTCEMPFVTATRDDDESKDFCELYAPWRLLKTERKETGGRDITVCHVESTLICEQGWWQIMGHCFKMPDKPMVFTRDEAVQLCKDAAPPGTVGEIAFMHHKYIVGVYRRYFKGTPQIWVNATETWDQYIKKTNTVDGDALALAFTGTHFDFSVGANSLIRIDGNVKLNTLCQYKPPITPAEINYLGRRYSEIYYPSIPVENGIMVRSASSYTRTANNWDVCKKVLKPFMIEKIGDFVPDDSVLQSMTKMDLGTTLTYLTRSGAVREMDDNGITQQKTSHTCSAYLPEYKIKVENEKYADFPVKNIKVNESTDCDNMLSAAIIHQPRQQAQLEVMSDSRSLPIWCKLGRPERFKHKDPPPEYDTFRRTDGKWIAFKLHKEHKTYEQAKQICESEGSKLTGIDSDKEARKMIEMAVAQGENNKQFWVGGRRRDECKNIDKWNPDKSSNCYRSRVIQWEHNMAKEFEESWWKDGKTEATRNPDFSNKNQECLTIVVGNPNWADPKSGGFLDDLSCDGFPVGFFCSQFVEASDELADD